MKKVFLSILSILAISFSIQAQDIAPAKALKKAGKALSGYNLDPTGNGEKLVKAVEMIEIAMADETVASNPGAWVKAGEIYNALGSQQQNALQIAGLKGEVVELKNHDSALKATNAFTKALELAKKKYHKKDALAGLGESVSYLNLFANSFLGENADYATAFPYLDAISTVRTLLLDNGKKDIFTDPAAADQNQLLTAYAASAAGKTDRSMELFSDLITKESAPVSAYTMYIDVLKKADKADEASAVLAKAKAKFPGNKDLLFSEINEDLQNENYEALEGKLKTAIDAEPDNPSVHNVLGDVYQNLSAAALAAGNVAKSEEYFQAGLAAYNSALKLDPSITHSTYSLGSMYYNKAAAIVPVMNALGTSKADTKKYDELKAKMEGMFEQALPFFEKAEASNPNDRNTLIALKEIYARKNDFKKSGEYKARLEALEKK